MENLHNYYKEHVTKLLVKDFKYKSIMQVPRIDKVVINMGVGGVINNKKSLEKSIEDLTAIAGQKPMITRARKSISNFKIRQGQEIGCKVTLRRSRMWDFIEKLIFIVIPRIRDFRGLSVKSFDGRGNYTIGIKEQIIFPEIDYDTVDYSRGMDVTIVTSTVFDKEAYALLSALCFPFRK